ncbi:MAG: NifU family protein [Candidatus Zixiibacteriota bacterium]|nr:MAG: NifU family protein [candidate division Zixibacteria bacterium]
MADDAERIKITGEPSVDPMVCKFTVDHPIFPGGSFNCRSKETAEGSPLLEALFAIDGISQVMVADNSLTIVKTNPIPWVELGQQIGAVIREKIAAGGTLIAADVEKKQPSEEKIRQAVEELFERNINPAIASHGGRVELAEVEGTKVFVRLGGGCQGCASAHITLKHGIERAIREAVPEVTEVIDATDHTAGTSPFYR